MGLQGPVLAATDLSDAGDAALRQAHAIAADLGVPLTVGHVLPEAFRVHVLFPQEAGIVRSVQAELEHKAKEAVRSRIDAVIGRTNESIGVELESGTPHAGVLAIAERLGAGLVAVGSGATARRIARSAVCPVLIAKSSPSGGAVLGATDFSDPSLPAVRMAADEARRRKAKFRLLHCLDIDETALATPVLTGLIPMPSMLHSVVQEIEASARRQLHDALEQTGLSGEPILVRRPAAQGIVETARATAAALVVAGTRGRTGLLRLALGSVAEEVISEAPCSVLVVPLHSNA